MYKKIIKQSFKLNKVPLSWEKPICAAVCGALPIILGLMLNQAKYGIWASIGGFTYLYLFDEPYAQRLKKMFLIAMSITFCSTLGVLVSGSPGLIIVLAGLIGMVSTFLFGIFKINGPAAIFFIMAFTMSTGIPVEKSEIPIFISVILASSLFSWLVSMAGYFLKPYGPEIKKVNKLYNDIFHLAQSIGRKDFTQTRSMVVNSLKDTEEILTTGYINWKISFVFNRMYLLNEYANKMFLELLEVSNLKEIPSEILFLIEELKGAIDLQSEKEIKLKKIDRRLYPEYEKLLEIIYDIESIMNIPLEYIGKSVKISKPSILTLIKKSIDKKSIVFINSLRYGIVLSFSAFIAHKLNIPKSYWITLSCAAVMCGSTIMATFYRSLQRSIGTIIGVGIAVCISIIHPQGYLIAIFNMVLTILIELLIARNYALACIFVTPNAILIAESSSHLYSISNLASARIINIIIGSLIGLAGTYIIGRKSASSRLPDLMSKVMHSQSKVIFMLSTENDKKNIKLCKEKMEIDFNNFKLAYNTALGEIPNKDEILESMWPAVFSLEHINYTLANYCSENESLKIDSKQLRKIVFIYEFMCNSIEYSKSAEYEEIEIYDEIPLLCKEINTLKHSLDNIDRKKYNCLQE